MWDIFQKTLPFFALIGLGYAAGWTKFFSKEATVHLTRFVFYFALSAMIFGFAANLPLAEILDWSFVTAYLSAGIIVYILATIVALRRKIGLAEAAVEAQCAVVGNAGFLGIPMLVLLLGPQSVGPVLMVLIVDFIVFGNLLVILITIAKEGQLKASIFKIIAGGLIRNPMIVSLSLGIIWSA
ncbi:MAG: AEC family transporter, partial [Paracoccaceae bacterium]